MTGTQKKTLYTLVFLGLIYFLIFIAPNLTGAKNEIMLSVFEQDEFAEYPFVLRMLTSDLTFYQAIRHFVIYLFYYYGYPFFFFSALSILPIKWLIGPDWTANTQLILVVLRQVINVLPAILSVGILVYMQTRFRSIWKSVLLFLFLLTIPSFVFNNMWWHPDGLLLLFVTLTLFFLDRDDFRFGRNFYLAAICTGVATSTKILGLFFFLAVGVYLIWGIQRRKLTIKRAVVSGTLFIAIMAASIVISYPVLLLPIERKEVITAMQSGFSQLSYGFYEKTTTQANLLGFNPELKLHFGGWYFLLIALIVPVFGIIKNKNRLINTLILSWTLVHILYFTFFTSVIKSYYFLPSLLPLFSCLGTLFLLIPDRPNISNRHRILPYMLASLVAGLIILQTTIFIRTDVQMVRERINREENSQNLRFYSTFNQSFLDKIPGDRPLIIYRDWRMYIEPKENWTVAYDWNFANYALINELNPDVILIEYENAHYFSDKKVLENALDIEKAEPRFEFYADAYAEKLNGYHLLFKDNFGYAFVSNDFYDDYFK